MKRPMKILLAASAVFMIVLVFYSCQVLPVVASPTGGGSTSFTVVSPANGSSVGVPFTISGTCSSDIETVVLSFSMKNSQVSGGNWSITIGSNDVGLGLLEFTLQAKNRYSYVLSNISVILNVTNNGSTNVIVHIVGQMTNHFSGVWKVCVYDSFPIYGIAGTNGLFDIPVAAMRGNVWVGAFKDDNANGILDTGEYEIDLTADGKWVNVQGTNISNVFINIPDINSRTIGGNVTGNIFGLPLGVVLKHTFGGLSKAYYYSAPNTSASFSYSITLSGSTNDSISVGYYIDDNGDGKWNYDPDNFAYESSRFAGGMMFTFPVSNTNNVDLNLCGKMVGGTVTGGGGADFNGVWADIGGGEKIFTRVSSGDYSVRFYIHTNEGVPMFNSIQAFIDQNNNIIREMHETSVYHTNGFVSISNGTTVTTNTRDFVIDKITHVGVIEGNAASEFKLSKLVGMYYDVRSAPCSWTDYLFQGDTNTSFSLYAFIDSNANGQYDDYYLSFSGWGYPSNSVVTNRFFIQRGIADVTVSGSYAGYAHPMIRNHWQGQSFHYPLTNSHTLTNYWETNSASNFALNIFVFNDTNNNGTYQTNAAGGEPLIATNAGGGYVTAWTNYVATTNFTLFVTN